MVSTHTLDTKIVLPQFSGQTIDNVTQDVFLALHGSFSRGDSLQAFRLRYGMRYLHENFGKFRAVTNDRKQFAYFGGPETHYLVGFLDLGVSEGGVTITNAPVSELYPHVIHYPSAELAFLAYLLSGGIATSAFLRTQKIEADVTFDANFRSLDVLKHHLGDMFIASYSNSAIDDPTIHLVIGTNRNKEMWREMVLDGNALKNILLLDQIKSYLRESGYYVGILKEGVRSLSGDIILKDITILQPALQFKPPTLTSPPYSSPP